MTTLAAERIKLLSTRSPWWTAVLAIGLVVGMTTLLAATWQTADNGDFPFAVTGFFVTFGMVVMMVMATVAITSEYRFGTIRTTFQAMPNRTAILLAKTLVVALAAGVVGTVAAFGAWGMGWLLRPGTAMAVDTAAEWRALAGVGLVWAIAAVIAVAVGILLRQTAGAVSLLLVWVLLVEALVALIPKVGPKIQHWLPFTNANNFLQAGIEGAVGGGPGPVGAMPLGPWASLAYLAALAAGLLAIAVAVANRRDA